LEVGGRGEGDAWLPGGEEKKKREKEKELLFGIVSMYVSGY